MKTRNRKGCMLVMLLVLGLGVSEAAAEGPVENLSADYRNPARGAAHTNALGRTGVQLGVGNGLVAMPNGSVAGTLLGAPVMGRSADYFLGEAIEPPEGWNGKEPTIAADTGGKVVWIDFAKQVVSCAAGPVTITWTKADGSTEIQSVVVSSAPQKRPVRLYWTHEKPKSLDDSTYRTRQNAGPTVTFESNYLVHLYGTPNVKIYGENGEVGNVRLNGNSLEAFEGTYGTFLIAYSRLDEAQNSRELLAYEIVEVLEPKQTLLEVKIGNQLKPQTRSYDTEELFPSVTRGASDAADSGEIYVYQHSTGEQKNYIWAIRDSSANPWKIEVFWRAKEELDVVWPFEVDIYSASWDVAGAQAYVRAPENGVSGAANQEPVVYYPSGLTVEAMPYQVVSDNFGGTKIREHVHLTDGVFYTDWADEASYALLKYTSGENVWFQTVRSVSAGDTNLLARLALDFTGARTNAAYRTGSATNAVGAIDAWTDVALADEIRPPFAGEGEFFYPGWVRKEHECSAGAYPVRNAYNPDLYRYPAKYAAAEDISAPIFPVNLGELEVWWSLPSQLMGAPRENGGATKSLGAMMYFPAIPVTYAVHTPEQIAKARGIATGCPQIVIASGAGSAGWSLNDHFPAGEPETSAALLWQPGSAGVTGVVTRLSGMNNTLGVTSNFTFEARLQRQPGAAREIHLASFYAGTAEGDVSAAAYLRLGTDNLGNFYVNGTNLTASVAGGPLAAHQEFCPLPRDRASRADIAQGVHLAFVHTADGTWTCYLNGDHVGSYAGHPCAVNVADDTANLFEPAPAQYAGPIHYVRFWSAARKAKEIDQNRYLACGAATQLVFQYDGPAQEHEGAGEGRASGPVAYGYLADSSGHDARGNLGFGREVDGADASLWMTAGVHSNVTLRMPHSGRTFSGDAKIYVQNDPTQPGYNPNEEHALLVGSVAHALRCDLNVVDRTATETNAFTSLPYVLVQYTDADTGDPAMCALRVVPENDMYRFRRYLDAGSMVQSPDPLARLQPANLQTFVSGPLYADTKECFLDRKGWHWAHQAGNDGGPTNYVFELSYPNQAAFDYPAGTAPAEGEIMPWMANYRQRDDFYVWTMAADAAARGRGENLFPERPATDPVGTAIDYTYVVVWPDDVPGLYVNDTLHNAKDGLPAVRGQLSAKVVYQQSTVNGGRDSVRIIDSETRQSGSLKVIPDDIRTYRDPKTSKRLFTDLPPFLRERFLWNPTAFYDANAGETRELELTGKFIEDGNYQFSYLNVMDDRSIAVMLDPDLVPGAEHPDWGAGVKSVPTEPIVLEDDNTPFTAMALTTTGKGAGYVTLVFNDSTNLSMVAKSEVITMYVIKVVPELYNGYLHVIQSDNPLDKQINMKYTSDFGAKTANWEFQWQYCEPKDGTYADVTDETAWLSLAGACGKPGIPLTDWVTVGDAGVFGLSDHYVRCRYRSLDPEVVALVGDAWSNWCAPKLAEGWIKRVLKAINPFDQKIRDFLNNKVDTSLSMIQQAGQPYDGDIPLNQEALTENGLIPIYETVLNQAKKLSIDADYTATESLALSLQMAAGRIAELYMTLGNEAYADALNPTVDLGSGSGVDDTAESSVFPFMNQCENLLDEELCLLRGRDLSTKYASSWTSNVEPYESPFYNRLPWNFTQDIMGGQVAYVENYGIRDVCGASDAEDPAAKDGVIDVYDAKKLYPQGHGDAWGHYLSAEKGYYALLRHPNFGWKPQIEGILAGQTEITIGNLHEKRFAQVAEMKAKVGEKIVADTYRQRYVAGSDDPWLEAEDDVTWTDADGNTVERAWGVDEWATRAHLGAYYDWATVNAILPAREASEGLLRMLDRESTKELSAIAASARRIQAAVRSADSGLNPLGLSDNAIPFDISPQEIDAGKTHFEQILERAKKATKVAKDVFDRAKACANRLRDQNASADYEKMVDDEEAAIERRLIEIYGYPYDDDIGPGKTYEQGYSGPDLYHYYYVETYDLDGSGGINGDYITRREGGSYGRYIDVNVSVSTLTTKEITGTYQAEIDTSLADNGLVGNLVVGALSFYQSELDKFGDQIDNFKKYSGFSDAISWYNKTQDAITDYKDTIATIGGVTTDDLDPLKKYGVLDSVYYKTPEIVLALPVQVLDTAGDTRDGRIDYSFSVAACSNISSVVSFYVGENGFAAKPADWHGQRKAEGETQIALNRYAQQLSEINVIANRLYAANEKLEGRINELTALDYKTQMTSVFNSAQTEAENYIAACKHNFQAVKDALEMVKSLKEKICSASVESLPTCAGLASDVTSAARAAFKVVESGLSQVIEQQIDELLYGSDKCDAALEKLHETISQEIAALESNTERTTKIDAIEEQTANVRAALAELENAFLSANETRMNYAKIVAEGDELQAERERLRIQWAADLSQSRYRNMMYQILRNDELTRYNQAFEQAAKYVFLAAKAYDYETGLLQSDSTCAAGSAFMTGIVRARALGRFNGDGEPLVGGSEGDPGLADILARMEQNWGVLKSRLGFNNAQGDLDSVSLRKDLFGKDFTSDGDDAWKTALANCWTDDLRSHPAFAQHCQPFDPMESTEPGFVIPFRTTIAARQDLFGNDLGGGSTAYSSTYFATKLRAVGVWIEGTNATSALPKRPDVYLIPAGLDYMRAPIRSSSTLAKTRTWQVVDQVLPVPYSLSESDWESTDWSMLKDIFANELCTQRRHPAIRANVGPTFDEAATMTYNARLIGRSVWNDQWYIFIPAASLNKDNKTAKQLFLDNVKDIHLNLKTYSLGGN